MAKMVAEVDTLCHLTQPKEGQQKNNQNCQKIKLYGSPTIKELKKKHSSRPVGGVETGSWDGEDSQQGGGWRTRMGKAAAGGVGGPTFVFR